MSCQYSYSYDYKAGSFNTIHVLVVAFSSASEAQSRLLNISTQVIYKPDITEKTFLLLVLSQAKNISKRRARTLCYKVMQVFMVTGLFAGQHNTKLHGTITGVILFFCSTFPPSS